MNPRIRELIEQARKEELGNEFPQDVYEQEAVQQRLVQLVVRECAGVVFKKTGPKSALDVLEHFGVLE